MTSRSGLGASMWAAGLLLAFAAVGLWRLRVGGVPGDQQLLLAARRASCPGLDEVMTVASAATDPWPLAVVASVMAAAALLRDRARAWWFLAVVGTAWLLNPVLKRVFALERPGAPVLRPEELGDAFPAGHAANTTVLLAAAVVLLWGTPWRRRALVAATLALLLVWFAQLGLGRHYPSDLLAGSLWALAWVLLALRWFPGRT
jgi:undecaprenyl-diphosphatase